MDSPSRTRGLRDWVRGARRGLRLAWTALRAALDYVPLTPMGAAFAALGAWAYFDYSQDEADFVVTAAAAVAMGLVAASVLFVGLGAVRLSLLVRKQPAGVPSRLTTGSETQTRFRCPRLRFWPLVQVGLQWAAPADVDVTLRPARAWLDETITARERGRYERITRRFTVRDIFGFARVRLRRSWDVPLQVAPLASRADVNLAIRRATADGYSHPAGQPRGEMVEMRRYAHGDPLRFVLWKSYARSRRLMVRQAERAIAPRPAMVAFFIAAPGDEPSASTARFALENGLLGNDFVFCAEGAARPTADRREALEQLIASRHHRDTQADGLGALFRTVDRSRLDNLVVFAPASEGPWQSKLLQMARRLPLPPMVVLTVDGSLNGAQRRGRAHRFVWGVEPSAPSLLAAPRIVDTLKGAHMDVHVVHRPTGREIDAARLDAMRAL